MRREIFYQGGFYHIYNRGVDKRTVFCDDKDYERFLLGLNVFNQVESVGNLRDYMRFQTSDVRSSGHRMSERKQLVEIIVYCLLPNHFHFILKQIEKDGVSKFMQKLSNGYTKYFNTKYHRSGVLFQGKYKVKHIDSDEYLLWLSAYINANAEIHKIKPANKHCWSSYSNYVFGKSDLVPVNTRIVMSNFSSGENYQNYLDKIIPVWQERKEIKEYIIE